MKKADRTRTFRRASVLLSDPESDEDPPFLALAKEAAFLGGAAPFF